MLDQDAGLWVGPDDGPDTYRLVSLLGHGGEGAVWRAELPLSEAGRGRVAIKIQPDPDVRGSATEWTTYGRLLAAVHHPGLVRVREVFVGPDRHPRGQTVRTGPGGRSVIANGTRLRYVVMDFVDGRPLTDWIEENPTAGIGRRLRLLSTVADALDELHSGRQTAMPVAHGDVKPGNMIVTVEDSTVLVDLGGTRLTDGPGEWLLTRAYAAPELYAPDSGGSTPEADRFAFVASMVHLLIDEPPTLDAAGRVDLDAVATRLGTHPRTADEPLLRAELLAALRAEPGGRPAPLATYLTRLNALVSRQSAVITAAPKPSPQPSPQQTTFVREQSPTEPTDPPEAEARPGVQSAAEAVRRRPMRRATWLGALSTALLAMLGVVGWILWSSDRQQDAGPSATAPTAVTAVAAAGTERLDQQPNTPSGTLPPTPTPTPRSSTASGPTGTPSDAAAGRRTRTPGGTAKTRPTAGSGTGTGRPIVTPDRGTTAPVDGRPSPDDAPTTSSVPPAETHSTTSSSAPQTRTGTVHSCNTYGQNCNAKNIYVSIPPTGYDYTTFPRITTVPNGTSLTARCWVQGGRTYNWAAKIAKPDPGPNPYDSTVYYFVQVPGSSRWGYFPDTYFVRDKTGKLGLPAC